jgi:hypothetical protein
MLENSLNLAVPDAAIKKVIFGNLGKRLKGQQ